MLTLVSGCTIQVAGLQTISEEILHVGTGDFVFGSSGGRNVSTSVFQLVISSRKSELLGAGQFYRFLVNGRINIGETIQLGILSMLGELLSFQKYRETSQINLLWFLRDIELG